MNRAQRRRAERAKGRSAVDDRETGYRATGVGRVHQAAPMADLPPQVRGRHRWVAAAGYTLTDSAAALAYEGTQVVLRPRDLYVFGVSCIDCERPYSAAVVDLCPGYPVGGSE